MQLASGLNKAAEAMQDSAGEGEEGGARPDVSTMKDKELFQLLEEAYSYRKPNDRQGKSDIFRVSKAKIETQQREMTPQCSEGCVSGATYY